MRRLLLLMLLFQYGCATKYILPGNRFMTPESQGGLYRGQFEIQQTSANALMADLSTASVENGVISDVVTRTGFLSSLSLLDEVDIFWTHTGGGNSLLGAKFQFLGTSRTGNGAGHKMAVSAAVGGNEHEIEGSTSIEFELGGSEYQLLYGYRFNEMILVYSTFSYASYSFSGSVKSQDPNINGLEPAYNTMIKALYGGLEIDFSKVFAKLESGYQQIKTSNTKEKSHFIYGFSIGLNW